MIQTALEGLRVVDLTHYIAGPYCSKLLADYGADVVKVERPGDGDGARRLGPFPGDVPDNEKSGIFLHLNTSKRGAAIDLKTSEGAAVVRRMVEGADILVENFQPRVMPALGLDYETLKAINPNLVMVSISNFGQTGPYRDYRGSEIVNYALGGPMYCAGLPDRYPLKLGGSVISYLGGAHAAAATAMAVLGVDMHGHGDHVDISIMQTQAASPDRRTPMLVGYQYTGQVNHRGMLAPPAVRPCKDGYVNVQFAIAWIGRLAKMLGMPELATDPRFADPTEASKAENADLLEGMFMGWLGDRTMQEAWEAAQDAHLMSGPIYTFADVMEDPGFQARAFWEEIIHPVAGRWSYPGLPFKTFGAEQAPRMPAPRLGEHTREVLAELGYGHDAIDEFMARGVAA